MPLDDAIEGDVMKALLARQKAAQTLEGAPSAAVRIDRIDRAIDLLVRHRSELDEAVSSDFGHRSKDVTAFADTATSIGQLKFAKKHLRRWMRPERRGTEFPLGFLGAAVRIERQPKGVVGIIAPWNFPIGMAFGPLAGVLAAGNRAMIKPSEFTEATSALIASMVQEAFDESELAVVTGGPDVGAAFSKLPFDHIIFTGSTSVGKHVMRAAADHLVPVTLELGGKSPAILGRSADFEKAAARIMHGKVLNAGQICLAPDYAIAPAEKIDEFVGYAKSAVATMFPEGLKDSDDYTSIINRRHFDRLQGYLDDARAKGADVVEINPKGEDFTQQPHFRMPPTLVLNPTDEMTVMQDEIFGPVLPVKTYRDLDDAVDYVNDRDRPLALYYFGDDRQECRRVVSSTNSGGVTVNDVIFHIAQEDLPFGGVGASGMGAYHGRDGFDAVSHKKSVYEQTRSELIRMLRPPYGDLFRSQINGRIKK
ncbi:MAG: coniferyl aldehyde dehydrogenase [Pseudomonadota bacterium]